MREIPLPSTPAAMRARAAGYVCAANRILAASKALELQEIALELMADASDARAWAAITAGDYPTPARRRVAPLT